MVSRGVLDSDAREDQSVEDEKDVFGGLDSVRSSITEQFPKDVVVFLVIPDVLAAVLDDGVIARFRKE
jgi:hypothetical protein